MKATSTHWRGPNTLGQDDLKSWMGRLSAFINHSSFFIIIEQTCIKLKAMHIIRFLIIFIFADREAKSSTPHTLRSHQQRNKIQYYTQQEQRVCWTSLQSDRNLRGPRVVCSRRCASPAAARLCCCHARCPGTDRRTDIVPF